MRSRDGFWKNVIQIARLIVEQVESKLNGEGAVFEGESIHSRQQCIHTLCHDMMLGNAQGHASCLEEAGCLVLQSVCDHPRHCTAHLPKWTAQCDPKT